jgi:hypothetical protein
MPVSTLIPTITNASNTLPAYNDCYPQPIIATVTTTTVPNDTLTLTFENTRDISKDVPIVAFSTTFVPASPVTHRYSYNYITKQTSNPSSFT